MPREIDPPPAAPPGRFAIVVSRYHESITTKLLDGAVSTLAGAGVPDENIEVAWVPGAWEIPLIAAGFYVATTGIEPPSRLKIG